MSLTRRYYLFQFLFSMLFWTPIFFEFQKRLGLSEGEIFRIQSLYYLAFCFLEIPTGFFADRVGYLPSLRLGSIMLLVSHGVAIAGYGYGSQLAHWLLLALARSLVSGASSAYLYEALREKRETAEYQRVEGRARAWTLYGRVACFAVVGYLMEVSLKLPYWMTAGSAALALLSAFSLPSISQARAHEAVLAKASISLRHGLRIVLGSPRMMFVMVQGVVIFVLGRIVTVNLFQPILGEKGIDARHFGVWMGALTLAEAWGSMTPHHLKRFGSLNALTFALSFAMAVSLLPIHPGGAGVTVGALLLFSLFCGWAFPIQKQWMNDVIPDPAYRATLLSIESIVDRAACAGVALILERVVTSPRGPGVYAEFFLESAVVSAAFLGFLLFFGWRLRRELSVRD